MTATGRPTSVCVYDGTPSVVVRTGDAGHPYGLCASCLRCTSLEPVTVDSVRTEIREILTARSLDYATQDNGDQRAPGVRALDIYKAARLGLEDVQVGGRQQAQHNDPHCETVRPTVSDLYNVRLGDLLCGDLRRLFEACADAATQEGRNVEREVTWLADTVNGVLADVVEGVLKAHV
ncbi:hypothetical protein [Streptomyces apocyni]|uniref:hypothetical protein n=1 Tax=Streptomyces apocyni TaxID=2654677 RepID=UPI0012EA062D|nr:hypothetical protein [Streptomyces apocyni]